MTASWPSSTVATRPEPSVNVAKALIALSELALHAKGPTRSGSLQAAFLRTML